MKPVLKMDGWIINIQSGHTGQSTIWWRTEEPQQEALSDAFIDIQTTTGNFCDDVIASAVAVFLSL